MFCHVVVRVRVWVSGGLHLCSLPLNSVCPRWMLARPTDISGLSCVILSAAVPSFKKVYFVPISHMYKCEMYFFVAYPTPPESGVTARAQPLLTAVVQLGLSALLKRTI